MAMDDLGTVKYSGRTPSADPPALLRLRELHVALTELLDDPACREAPAEFGELAARTRAFAQLLGAKLKGADPLLVWRGGLEALAGCIGSLLQELRTCLDGYQPLHQASAETFLDQAHAYLNALPTLGAADGAGYLAAFVATQREQQARLLGACTATLDEVRKSLAGAGGDLIRSRSALTAAHVELERFQARFTDEIERLGASGDELMAAQQRSFADRLAEQAGSHAGQLDGLRREGVRLLSELRALLDETRDSVAVELEQLATRAPTAQVAASFGRFADEERRIADRLRFIAVCFLAAAGVLSIVFTLFAGDPGRPAALQELAVRVAGALSLGLPGVYAAVESGRHRRAEARHRKSELDLHALDPVLRGLSPDKRERMREQITERIFNRRSSSSRGL